MEKKPKIALLCSEPIKLEMGGIGIRYLEMAKHLPDYQLDIVLIHPGEEDALASFDLNIADIRPFRSGQLKSLLSDCDCVVAQGQLANHLPVEAPEIPAVIDLYDPWLIENLNYYETLGIGPFWNDLQSWITQLSHGDFFLCSSQEQRHFYIGFLAALGRINPKILQKDPDLQGLITQIPFGVPDELPPYNPYLPESKAGEKRLLFGGVYDWYDPWTLLDALERLKFPEWTLLFMKSANPELTPQKIFNQLQKRVGIGQTHIQFLDRVPVNRRFDLLRDVDVLVAPHKMNIETHLSLRTRFIEALAVGIPIICTKSGSLSQQIEDNQAGWVVPPQDSGAILVALEEIFRNEDVVAARGANALNLARRYRWKEVLEPLAHFCKNPRREITKEEFANRMETNIPKEPDVSRFHQKIRDFLTKTKQDQGVKN
jgi:glycosyltransferase involved in cell wall biosynthesis